jgi:TPR repeat protein
MYATGKGVDANVETAFFWLTLAKNGGDTYFETQLESVYNRLNKGHLKTLNYRIREWKPKAGKPASSGKREFGD